MLPRALCALEGEYWAAFPCLALLACSLQAKGLARRHEANPRMWALWQITWHVLSAASCAYGTVGNLGCPMPPERCLSGAKYWRT